MGKGEHWRDQHPKWTAILYVAAAVVALLFGGFMLIPGSPVRDKLGEIPVGSGQASSAVLTAFAFVLIQRALQYWSREERLQRIENEATRALQEVRECTSRKTQGEASQQHDEAAELQDDGV